MVSKTKLDYTIKIIKDTNNLKNAHKIGDYFKMFFINWYEKLLSTEYTENILYPYKQ